MSFVRFLVYGEAPVSKREKELEQQVSDLEARLQRHQESEIVGSMSPIGTLMEMGAAPAAAASATPEKAPVNKKFVVMLIVVIAMVSMVLLSLVGVLLCVLYDKEVPDIFQILLSGSLSYFGGALHAYMGVKT